MSSHLLLPACPPVFVHQSNLVQLRGMRVAVFGSEDPWIESLAFHFGAKHITVFEYAPIENHHPNITTVLPKDLASQLTRNPREFEKFDAVISFSSFEHDGLGRYGDPINPYGDLQSLVKVACVLKPGGIFHLGFDVNENPGGDALAWNAHRGYGPLRLPLVLRHFRLLEVFGQTEAKGLPWLVMQNMMGCANAEFD